MSRAMTNAEADALIAHLSRRFGAHVASKESSVEMQMLGAAFGVLRALGVDVPSAEEWPRYATTLGPIVYMPRVDDPLERVALFVHEIGHVWRFFHGKGEGQAGIGGGFEMAWLYLTQGEARVRYEVEAERGRVEFMFAITGSVGDPRNAVGHGYSLNEGEQRLSSDLLEIAATAAMAGRVVSPVAAVAIEWVHAHCPDVIQLVPGTPS